MKRKVLTGQERRSANEIVESIKRGLVELFDLLDGADEDAGVVWTDDDGTEIKLTLNESKEKTKSAIRCQIEQCGETINIQAEYPRD